MRSHPFSSHLSGPTIPETRASAVHFTVREKPLNASCPAEGSAQAKTKNWLHLVIKSTRKGTSMLPTHKEVGGWLTMRVFRLDQNYPLSHIASHHFLSENELQTGFRAYCL